MTMVALLTKPWLSSMREAQVSPRCLADDLLFLAIGNQHQARCINAMQISKTFFTDIGAKVADKKCFTFAADPHTREFLNRYRWDEQGLTIPSVSNFRDLGAHLNLSKANNGKTLADRMRKATSMAKRLKWLPIPLTFKEDIIRANVLPAGLYAVEASSTAVEA